MKKEILECVENLLDNDKVEITLLEDNKYTRGSFVAEVRELTRAIEIYIENGYSYDGGTDREFYMVRGNSSVTFQVSAYTLTLSSAEDIAAAFIDIKETV